MAIQHASAGEVVDLGTFGGDRTVAVVKEQAFEVMRVVVAPGKPFPPHKVDGPITVQCLSGRCTFSVGDKPLEMSAGSWLHLAGGAMHSLESKEGAVMLVTIMFAPKSEDSQ